MNPASDRTNDPRGTRGHVHSGKREKAPSVARENALRAARESYRRMVDEEAVLCRIVSDAELQNPLQSVDAVGWLGGNIHGWDVLCLAGGGGRQSCLYAAAGANVTVVDLSPAMLDLDRRAAKERNFSFQLFEGSMDDLSMLPRAGFDLVIHPVSSCYLPDIGAVYRQVAEVTKPGGLYISQHKSPVSLQTSVARRSGRYTLDHRYYRTEPVPPPNSASSVSRRLREPGAVEFLHRWEDLIGGLGRSGFVIEDLVEPMHADLHSAPDSFEDRATFVPPYVRIKARRQVETAKPQPSPIWLPDEMGKQPR